METLSRLAGEPAPREMLVDLSKLERAYFDTSRNGASIGGLKVVAERGWFAASPSGTENIYKIYAESFRDEAHLQEIVSEAQEIVHDALASNAVKQ